MKKLVALIPVKGKTKEEVSKELMGHLVRKGIIKDRNSTKKGKEEKNKIIY